DQGEFADLYLRGLGACASLFRIAGADPGYGSKLPRALRDAGLVDVGAQFYVPLVHGTGPTGFIYLTIAELRGRLVDLGLRGAAEVQRFLDLCAPGATYAPPVTVSAWGRRPFSL